MIVALDGTGDFRSIQAAVAAIPPDNRERVIITVRPGVYREKVSVTSPWITLRGENSAATILSWNDHALKLYPDGTKYGTFNSYTLFVGADDFCAEGLTIENTSGPAEKVGQAIAAYVDADRVVFRDCFILGYQDTLCTGPLPLKPLTGNSFGGPREGVPPRYGRQYYDNCAIRGDVDFIFGSATAVFHGCEIISRECGKPVNGFITAASTPPESAYGYLFYKCRLTGEACERSVYLGRPWRENAKTVFIDCWMGEQIKAEGWHNWDKPAAEQTAFYAEAGSTGPGGDMSARVAWSHRLSPAESGLYTPAAVLAGADGWQPVRS